MKRFKYWLALGAVALMFSCGSEDEDDITPKPSEDRCEDNNATLSGSVGTIISTNCAISGCHVSGTDRVDLTVKANIIQNATLIRTYTESGFMPEASSGRTLTQAQKDDIFCWVENGAQDN